MFSLGAILGLCLRIYVSTVMLLMYVVLCAVVILMSVTLNAFVMLCYVIDVCCVMRSYAT